MSEQLNTGCKRKLKVKIRVRRYTVDYKHHWRKWVRLVTTNKLGWVYWWDMSDYVGHAGNIYCKRGSFRWGKISRKCWQDISRGGNFHDTAAIYFIKACGFNFRVGVIFAKKTKARKTRKLPPRENFHVYSIILLLQVTKNNDPQRKST